jgi:tetratricopeptide (TPR) repeat protein
MKHSVLDIEIFWENNMQEAFHQAERDDRPVLLDFYAHDNIGCRRMSELTYSNDDVIKFVNTTLIPLRIPYDRKPLAEMYNIIWTPAIYVLDADGNIHYETIGFLGPDDFVSTMLTGMGMMYYHLREFEKAEKLFNRSVQEHPASARYPEAVYMRGVCRYLSGNDSDDLKEIYTTLKDKYPRNEWTKKAVVYMEKND